MRLYSMPSSGNSYKVRLLLALSGRAVDRVDCEAGSEALERARAGSVLPFGKLPVLELDDGRILAESNAILWYLGEGGAFVPADPADRAAMLGWMFWEQYSHKPVIAVRQALVSCPHRAAEATPARLADLLERGHALLTLMERDLEGRDWLVGAGPSLADLCLYAYTHSAGRRGGYAPERFPTVVAWLLRIGGLPGHVALDG